MSHRFASAISAHPVAQAAVGEVLGEVVEQHGTGPDLAVVTFTAAHVPHAHHIAATLNSVLAPRVLVGTSAVGVVGCGIGIENEPGITLWTGSFDCDTHTLEQLDLRVEPSGQGVTVTGHDDERLATADALLLFTEPWTFPLTGMLQHLSQRHPHLRVLGGVASAGHSSGQNRLIAGQHTRDSGAVGVLVPHGVLTATVVSQGCRPIGQPWTVTAAHGNVIEQLGGQPALHRLRDVMSSISPVDRALAVAGLHCGLLADDRRLDPDRGDFLVRGVVGIDEGRATVSVSAEVTVGMVVQFHVRDASTAGDDLAMRLRDALSTDPAREHGALVFTCNGRGRSMFDTPHHDAAIVHQVVGPHTSGLMCAGEIGPVAGRTQLHGFTASVAVF